MGLKVCEPVTAGAWQATETFITNFNSQFVKLTQKINSKILYLSEGAGRQQTNNNKQAQPLVQQLSMHLKTLEIQLLLTWHANTAKPFSKHNEPLRVKAGCLNKQKKNLC